jgi:hypothetical protein
VSYKRFPPWRGHVLVPVSSTREACAGLFLYTPTRRRGLMLRRAAEWMVRVLGPGALPGRCSELRLPDLVDGWGEIERMLRRDIGPFDAMAVHTRRLPHRPGAAVLLLAGGSPVAFLKVGSDESIENEHRVLSGLERSGKPLSFEAPGVLGFYSVAGLRVSVMTVILWGRHYPMTQPPLGAVVADVQRALQPLPLPQGIPRHWTPMHGDLSPWNLRVDAGGRMVLFDWEEAGFGPPGADEVYYSAASAALGLRLRPPVTGESEAVRYWQDRLSEPEPGRLRKAMLRELSRLGSD